MIPTISGFGFLRPEASSEVFRRTLTFADRVAYQTAIEDVYWRHRIWPDTNRGPKPPLDKVISQADIEKKVIEYLRNLQTLADYQQRPITADQLQAEMERMASNTRQPEVLQELFEALGNDPFVIAECLARPILATATSQRRRTKSRRGNHVTFVLPWRAKKGQYALASSSLGVSRELHLGLFPQGQPRRGFASHN